MFDQLSLGTSSDTLRRAKRAHSDNGALHLWGRPLAQANDPKHADVARMHFQRREARLAAQLAQREAELTARKAHVHNASESVLDALARAKAKKQESKQ